LSQRGLDILLLKTDQVYDKPLPQVNDDSLPNAQLEAVPLASRPPIWGNGPSRTQQIHRLISLVPQLARIYLPVPPVMRFFACRSFREALPINPKVFKCLRGLFSVQLERSKYVQAVFHMPKYHTGYSQGTENDQLSTLPCQTHPCNRCIRCFSAVKGAII
jgi:hypothetical protein